MINMFTCVMCGKEHPRSEHRKKGGGVHKFCRSCRKAIQNEQSRHKRKVLKAKQKAATLDLVSYMQRQPKILQVEFNKYTRENRNRLKVLRNNPRPTKATLYYLQRRMDLQIQWEEALQILLQRVAAGQRVCSLREFMEGRQCIDM